MRTNNRSPRKNDALMFQSLKRIRDQDRLRFGWSAFVALVMLCLIGARGVAQDEDDEPAMLAEPVAQFEIQENQFDSWVFQNFPNAQSARKKLDEMLDLLAEDVERSCKLSESQCKKLRLAGRGDILRFFDQVEIVRQKFLLVRKDQNKFNQIWQDISPLQVTFQAGLHDDDSLFAKTLRNMLDDRQRVAYESVDGERRRFQYRAKVELIVAMLDNALPLREQKRQKFISLILEKTKPPRRFGQQDYYVVMWNISKIPEADLKALFDDTEWKILRQQFNQVRGMEQWLKQSGLLESDDESSKDEKPKARALLLQDLP